MIGRPLSITKYGNMQECRDVPLINFAPISGMAAPKTLFCPTLTPTGLRNFVNRFVVMLR
jgi:hypothetical protein